MTTVVNFLNNFLFHLISYKILRKVTKFQRVRSKDLRVMAKKLRRVSKDPSPGPNGVKGCPEEEDPTLNTYRTAVSPTLDLLCHENFNVGRSKAESDIEIFMAQ